MAEPLTEEQIENWRKILCLTLGGYALIMPVEEIEATRAKMQKDADELAKEMADDGDDTGLQ